MSEIGREIKRMREGKGWSQAQLAVYAGSSQPTVNQIESGKRNPSTRTLEKLAAALDVEVADLFPKEQAPLPLEYEAVGRRPPELLTQRPSSAERIWLIEKAVDILRHYYDLGQREYSRMREDLAKHGTSYLWHGFYFNNLQPAMERDGLLLHASFVVDGPAEVSGREHAACEKLRDFDTKMQYLVWDMREIDDDNNALVREEVSRGVTRAQEWLERGSKSVAVHREEQRGEDPESTLSEKLERQLGTQVRVLRERQNIARSDEDLYEAAKDFHHWWLFTFDWLSTFLSMHPEYRGMRLEEAVNSAARAVIEEFPKDAINPRDVPDMAEVTQGLSANQSIDA